MKRVLALIAILGLWSLPLTAGEFLMNDSGETATALRVVFSEPVTITGFGDTLMDVSPPGDSTEFTFLGGQVEAWGSHWLNWEPESASLLSVEWLEELIAVPEFNPEEATTVPHTRQDQFQLALPEEDGGDIVGVVTRTLSVEQIPFSVTYEFESDAVDGDVEWISTHPETSDSPQIVTGSSARFVYLSNRNDPEVAMKFKVGDDLYEWTDPDVSFPLHNMTSIELDAEELFPEHSIVSSEWRASNGDPDDEATFPIDSSSATTASLVSQWPNALDMTCVATTESGEVVGRTTRALIYFKDGPPWDVHGTAMMFGAWQKVDTWRRVLDEQIELFTRLGINSVVLMIYWYYGYPDSEGNFSIEPVYQSGDEWSSDDPRGSTQKDEAIEYVFNRFDTAGIDVVAALLAEPNDNEPELQSCCDHAGYGSLEGFMQTTGYLYGDGDGLYNFYTHYIPLFMRTGVDGVLLGAEQGQVENDGGQVSREFFQAVGDEYRDQGFAGMITHPLSYAVCSSCDMNALVPDPEVYDPILCGVPWDDLGTLSVTFYPTLAETPEDTIAKMQEEALHQIRQRILPLHRVWGVPLFIADMYSGACDDSAMYPVDDDCPYSGVYEPEELRRYLTALLRGLSEATGWEEESWISGVTAGHFSHYPSWWTQSDETYLVFGRMAILDDRYGDITNRDAMQVFYRELPLRRPSQGTQELRSEVAHDYVPPTLSELGYALPETWDREPDFVIDDFEGDLQECGDEYPCWDGGGREKPDPDAYGNLSLIEDASGGHYLSDDFYYTSWLKVGHGLWLDASGYDGIQVKLWASSPMTVDFELGVCVDPWIAYMFRDLEVGVQPRTYRLPFSDFELDGLTRTVPGEHLSEICGMGFFPDSRGEANAIY